MPDFRSGLIASQFYLGSAPKSLMRRGGPCGRLRLKNAQGGEGTITPAVLLKQKDYARSRRATASLAATRFAITLPLAHCVQRRRLTNEAIGASDAMPNFANARLSRMPLWPQTRHRTITTRLAGLTADPPRFPARPQAQADFSPPRHACPRRSSNARRRYAGAQHAHATIPSR